MSERTIRKLAAIVSIDIVGYSRLIGADEVGTLARMKAHREELWSPLIERHGGRVVGTAGDSLLVEFTSAVSAVECALQVQQGMAAREANQSDETSMKLRVGVNIGEVVVDGDDIFGDGVNVAARLQAIAPPGGVCLSGKVYEEVDGKIAAVFEDAGAQEVKNIARPVHVWRWSVPGQGAAASSGDDQEAPLSVEKPSIAVLPFKNLSGDPEQEYFADGLTEDIITAISYWRSFPVIARNSTFTYKGRSIRPQQVARELGARYILEGSVRKVGNRVRVTATLVDTERGHELWADRFDRQLDDIFVLQDELTQKVAATIGYQIEQAEIARSGRRRNGDVTAWDLVAQGLPYFYEHTCEGNVHARGFFEQAVERAPRYSDGWAYLAWVHGHDLMIECAGDREATARLGIEAGRRAVSLDENSALAHLALSSVYIWTGDVASGLEEAKRALDLNPNDARAGLAIGNRLTLVGAVDEGIARIKAALALNPRDPYRWHYFGYLSRSYLSLHDPESAIVWARQAVQLRPDQAETHFRLALCHAHLDQLDDARHELAKCDELAPGFVEHRKSWDPYPDAARNEQLLAPLRNSGLL